MSLRKQNGQAGFSLVELMVVVAIIGVLATIAIPRVNRFIAKSRQSEAQVNLSSLYTFNKNFYVEFQGYTSSFPVMGFRPEGQIRYNTGFNSATAVGPVNYGRLKLGGAAFPTTGSTNTVADCAGASSIRCTILYGATNAAPPTLATTAVVPAGFATFRAEATSQLLSGSAAVPDVWSITENKLLVNNVDGTLEN